MIQYFLLAVMAASVAVILFIAARKLPQAANLDVERLPEEKEARKKREIIFQRVEARGEELKKRATARLAPLFKWWGIFQLKFRIYVGKMERLWHHEQKARQAERGEQQGSAAKSEKVRALIQEGEALLSHGKADRAEELFISAIKIDAAAANAYRALADAYLFKGAVAEAKETYQFLLKLEPDNDAALVKLAEIFESENDLERAIDLYQRAALINDSLSPRFYHLAELLVRISQYATALEAIKSALSLEPKNPKYLDLAVETAILMGDRAEAEEFFEELRLFNPENNKLAEFKERIGRL